MNRSLIEDPSAGIFEESKRLQEKAEQEAKKLELEMRRRQDDSTQKEIRNAAKKIKNLQREAEEEELDKKMLEAAKPKKIRLGKEEGGSMLVPPEMPVDTYTPEEQANAGDSQVSDEQMEDEYMDWLIDQSLDETEQEYLMNALESDPKLSEIFDKVSITASEFSGAGKVEGPGTGVSDSIPARLSDGEFVITEKATSMLGADNLQKMMDDAERMADGGKATRKASGGLLGSSQKDAFKLMGDKEEVEQTMLSANQTPSLRGSRGI